MGGGGGGGWGITGKRCFQSCGLTEVLTLFPISAKCGP